MGTRNRSRVRYAWAGGGVKRLNSNTYGATPGFGSSDYEESFDTTMSPPFVDDHPLVIKRRWTEPLVISGKSTEYIQGPVDFQNWTPANRADYSYCPTPTAIDFAYWKTKALGNMDPYKPEVDLPLFTFELREFPSMLRDLGKVLKGSLMPSDVPGGFLAHQFGWDPLISDVKDLFNFANKTQKRYDYFRKLEAGRRVKRTLVRYKRVAHSISKDAAKYYANVPTAGKWAYTADIENEEFLTVWYTANASLINPLPGTLAAVRALSARAAYGLTLRPETFWDAIPWSWMIDYFMNVGDYIAANSALTRLRVTRMNIMAKSECRSSLVNVRLASGLDATTSVLHTVQKQRAVYTNPPSELSAVPFLSGQQKGILTALVTASALRGYKA